MILDSKAPTGPIEQAWDQARFDIKLVNPGQQAQAHHHRRRHPAWPAPPPRPRWASSATTCSASASRIRPAARTPSPRRAASTPPRIIRTTATASTASSTTRSRAATSARARPTSTAWRRSASTSSTSASPRACPSPASTAASLDQPLLRRRPGLAHLLRPRPDRPAAAARRLPGARTPDRTPAACTMYPRTEMLDLIVIDGKARGIVTRNLVTGAIETPHRRRRDPGHRRLRQRLLPLHQRQGLAT